jgi:hypothetical protein
MIAKSERSEALDISRRVIAALMNFPIAAAGAPGAALRAQVGKYLGNLTELIDSKTVGPGLLACFDAARTAGATLASMNGVRLAMFAEAPSWPLGLGIVNGAIIFSFVEECQIIAPMDFGSRQEADTLIDEMTAIIEDIKLNKADSFVANDYQNFVALSALLIQHLSATERQLPRLVEYLMPVNYPALALANRIYGDASRSDELVAENETVHPAFMQRDVVALSE